MQNKIKVVVADDIESIAMNIRSIVASNERVEKVNYALDGEQEIQEIINLEADLVFTDMQMPKKTGIDVIEEIMSYPGLKKKPKFVLVTGDRDSSLIIKSRELGFDIEYKPIEPDRIHEHINNFEPVEMNIEAEKAKMKQDIEKFKDELKKDGFFRRLLNARKKEV